jgi:hypothetical protein
MLSDVAAEPEGTGYGATGAGLSLHVFLRVRDAVESRVRRRGGTRERHLNVVRALREVLGERA